MYSLEKLKQDKNNEFYDTPYKYDDIEILGQNTDRCIVRRGNNISLVKIRYDLQGYFIISKGKRYLLS